MAELARAICVITGWPASRDRIYGFAAREDTGEAVHIPPGVRLRLERTLGFDDTSHGKRVEFRLTTNPRRETPPGQEPIPWQALGLTDEEVSIPTGPLERLTRIEQRFTEMENRILELEDAVFEPLDEEEEPNAAAC